MDLLWYITLLQLLFSYIYLPVKGTILIHCVGQTVSSFTLDVIPRAAGSIANLSFTAITYTNTFTSAQDFTIGINLDALKSFQDIISATAFNITPHPLSAVGGYYPLTIQFEPSVLFPKNGVITLNNLKIQGDEFSCSKYIVTCSASNAYPCTISSCTNTGDSITINFAFDGDINKGISITLIILDVVYNTMKTPKSLTLTTKYSSSGSLCGTSGGLGTELETRINSDQWEPVNAASFISISTSFHPIPPVTCGLYDITWTIRPVIAIDTGSFLTVEFSAGTDISSANFIDFTDSSKDNTQRIIRAKTTSTYFKDTDSYFVIKQIKAPPISGDMTMTLKTYTKNNELVHSGTTTQIISYKTLPTPIIITLSDPLTIWSTGNYKFYIKTECGEIKKAKYSIKLPPSFIHTFTSYTHEPGDDLNSGTDKLVAFQLVNPAFVMTDSDLASEHFTITVSEEISNKVAFVFDGILHTDTKFKPGIITSFSVVPETQGTGDICKYTFTMTIPHQIPSAGQIHITINENVEWIDDPNVLLNSNLVSATYDITTHIITVNVPNIMNAENKETTITIVVENLKNPSLKGDYKNFAAVSYNKAGTASRIIDETNPAFVSSITIDKLGTATVTNVTNQTRNLEDVKFTFTFHSPSTSMPSPSGNANYLRIKVPNQVKGCALVIPSLDPICVTGELCYKILDNAIPSKSITLEVICKNPPTTALTDNFMFTLYNKDGLELLYGEKKIQTTLGASLTNLLVECKDYFPYSAVRCRITFKRGENTEIKLVVVYSDYLDTIDLSCDDIVVSNTSPLCEVATSPMRLLITFLNPIPMLTMIDNIKIRTPDYGNTTKIFTIETYTTNIPDPHAKVDEERDFGELIIPCKFPCKECNAFDYCTSCTDDISKGRFYFYQEKGECKKEFLASQKCENGYFLTTDYTCLKCDSTLCANCIDSKTKCTSCNTDKPRLVDFVCYKDCPSKWYATGLDTCGQCLSPCAECTRTATECTACETGFILYRINFSCGTSCPSNMFSDGTECQLCTGDCASCIDTATKCTSCKNSLYLLEDLNPPGDYCVDEQECIDMNRIPNSTTHKCTKCSPPCTECKTDATRCTKCSGIYNLYNHECKETCPSGTYPDNNICITCKTGCATCNNAITCLSCDTDMYFLSDTAQCVFDCSIGYYRIGKICYPCNSTCEKCDGGGASSCTTCQSGLLLYSGICYSTCPDGTYKNINKCVACSIECNGCTVSSTNCIACNSGYHYFNGRCYNPCPDGSFLNTGTDNCDACDIKCATCSGAKTFCTSCHGNEFAYGGICGTNCPNQTTLDIRSVAKVCINCEPGCDRCKWDSGNSLSPNICVECNWNYKYLDGTCLSICPTGFLDSSDGHSCVNTKVPSNGTTRDEAEETSHSYLPFPHLIAAGLLGIITAAGQSRDGRALLVSNLIIVLNYVTISSYIVQTISAQSENESIIMIISVASVIIQLVLNLISLITYKKLIVPDLGFALWSKNNGCIKTVILVLVTIITLQTQRLFYSRFMGFGVFFASFEDYNNIFTPLNTLSLLQITLVQSVIVVTDVFAISSLSWGTTLYITLIESLILSLILIILLCYEMKNTKDIKSELEKESQYSSLNDRSTLMSEMENGRKKMLERLFNKLFKTGKERPKRRSSFSSTTSYDKETDPRKLSSFPCSPRTTQNRMVPLKKYGIDEDKIMTPDELFDNVYAESAPPKDPKLVVPKDSADFGCQSPTFLKIDAFKKHLKSQGYRWKKRMFETPTPLEVIPETLDEGDDKTKLKEFSSAMIAKTLNFAEEDKLEISNIKRPASPPQSTDEGLITTMSKPLNPIDTRKVTLSKRVVSNFTLDDKPLSTPDKLPKIETPGKVINDEEILGLFEKDPVDGYILIRENSQGNLIDLRNRHVNKYGYLIDKDGNIINQTGEFVMSKEQFEKELEENENPHHTRRSNQLFESATTEKKHIEDEKVKGPIEERKMSENDARKSVSLDSLMQDTPSNYNIQNQRYDGPSIGLKIKGYPQIPEEGEPYGAKEVLNKIYGGRPVYKKRKNFNKSTTKRESERVFKKIDEKREYSSEIMQTLDETATKIAKDSRPKPNFEEVKLMLSNDNSVPEHKDSSKVIDPNKIKTSKTRNLAYDGIQTQIYSDKTQGILVPSDVDDAAFLGSRNPSIVSHTSSKRGKIKGLESIYLQRLDEPKNQKPKASKKHKLNKSSSKANPNKATGLEQAEVISPLSDNSKTVLPNKNIDTDNPSVKLVLDDTEQPMERKNTIH